METDETKLTHCNAVYEQYIAMYQKLREENREAKEDNDLEAEILTECLMRQMKKVIAMLHKALDRDPLETISGGIRMYKEHERF